MDKERLISKLDNFWYHYKVHVVVGVIVVATFLYLFINSESSNVSAINVIIVGNDVEEEERLSLQKSATKELLDNNTDLIIKHNFWLTSDSLSSGKHADLQGKLTAMVSGKDIDVIIMDSDAFQFYAEQGIFLKLQSFKKKNLEINKDQYIQAKGKYDQIAHVYGIKVDDNRRLKQAGYHTEDKVLAVMANTEDKSLSTEWVKWILEQ